MKPLETFDGQQVTRIRVHEEGDGWVVDGASYESFTEDVLAKWYTDEVPNAKERAVADALAFGCKLDLPVFIASEDEPGEWNRIIPSKGWVVFDPRSGKPLGIYRFGFLAWLACKLVPALDRARPGQGW